MVNLPRFVVGKSRNIIADKIISVSFDEPCGNEIAREVMRFAAHQNTTIDFRGICGASTKVAAVATGIYHHFDIAA